MAETRPFDQPLGPGKWRLRLIGSSPMLLYPRNGKMEINSNFHLKELRDYYIPNDKKIILRLVLNSVNKIQEFIFTFFS
jgi:hypothetical protein